MTVVPIGARRPSSIVYVPSPVDSQRVPSVSPALRVTSVTLSATMNAE